MDVDKYKIRSWSKDDFSTFAKYLNNKKIWDNCSVKLRKECNLLEMSVG